MSWYCDIAPGHPVHGPYHDHEYGFPVDDDRVLFERLCLEIFQAGLSWLIILKRRPGLNEAFEGFVPERVAAFTDENVGRLLADPRIIRNRRKVEAVVDNAQRVMRLIARHGSFAAWIEASALDDDGRVRDRDAWVRLFRTTFRFMGGEVVNEFLMSIGYLPGAHSEACPVQARIRDLRPRWMDST